jgi:hypothetical protein
MAGDTRQPLEQLFVTFTISVNSVPTPLSPPIDINAYVQSFTLCNPSVNTASVFWGDGQVTSSIAGVIGTGIELLTGTSQAFVIRQERQFYELQEPELLTAQKELCQVIDPKMIPVVVWNPQNFFLVATVAAAPVVISCCLFRNVYI